MGWSKSLLIFLLRSFAQEDSQRRKECESRTIGSGRHFLWFGLLSLVHGVSGGNRVYGFAYALGCTLSPWQWHDLDIIESDHSVTVHSHRLTCFYIPFYDHSL